MVLYHSVSPLDNESCVFDRLIRAFLVLYYNNYYCHRSEWDTPLVQALTCWGVLRIVLFNYHYVLAVLSEKSNQSSQNTCNSRNTGVFICRFSDTCLVHTCTQLH